MRKTIWSAIMLLASVTAAMAHPMTMAFVWKSGTFSLIAPAGIPSRATAINDAGMVVGEVGILSMPSGFVYDGTTLTGFNVPLHTLGDPSDGNGGQGLGGGYYTDLLGINNSGDMVGLFYDGRSASQNFLYAGGSYSPLPFIPPPGPYGSTVNAAGDSVQTLAQPVNPSSTVFRRVGLLQVGAVSTILDFDPGNGHISTIPMGINAGGTVVGYLSVPEPSSLAMFGSGVVMLTACAFIRRRRIAKPASSRP